MIESKQRRHSDIVFDFEASQEDVFFEISQLVQSPLDGFKVCIFAYGQTGSGKTYTMIGNPEAHEQKGLIPRSLEQIFETSEALKIPGVQIQNASMLEIYNETIAGNTLVSGITVVDVCSINEISFLLNQAAQSRYVGKTQMNEQSSKSHFVFILKISGMNDATEQQVQGILNLIDLVGSERLAKSGSNGDRLKETQAINKSLSCLSNVIFAIAKEEDRVPYRNSKLTYLLQSSQQEAIKQRGIQERSGLSRSELQQVKELKGNIRVFLRVRLILQDTDYRGADGTVVSYPTDVEYLKCKSYC
ncbi:hypothetical protein IEQ34_026425 [Dendrobium chrysotoxum]|uniref:Kinesin motor domain-containing protein n=1 Tax=Dendrobium chrysotoxum TaxID=161865 RepID=A0AAV7FLX7_DENCH|nr:hypothetical protein IEQ34_026425 [Dendrobium chrysotoxum]